MPVPHARVSEPLNQRNFRFELLQLMSDLLSHTQAPRVIFKHFDTLVHRFVAGRDALLQEFWVYLVQGLVHPRFQPFLPVGCCCPQVLVGLKLTDQLVDLQTFFGIDSSSAMKMDVQFR